MPDRPKRIVVDSGPIIALFDAGDAYHERALEFVRQSRARLISTMPVITEAMYVLDQSLMAQMSLLAWIKSGGLILNELEAGDFERVIDLMEQYADLPMDFADAVVVALCERLEVNHVATVDSDFTIYRYKGRSKFINVFLA
jgi:predicted nucleic acid-binding protein